MKRRERKAFNPMLHSSRYLDKPHHNAGSSRVLYNKKEIEFLRSNRGVKPAVLIDLFREKFTRCDRSDMSLYKKISEIRNGKI